MRKITLLSNSAEMKGSTVDFLCTVAKQANAKEVTGVFITDTSAISTAPHMELLAGQPYVEEIILSEEDQQLLDNKIADNIRLFKDICQNAGWEGVVKRVRGIATEVAVSETRFTDMVVVASDAHFGVLADTPSGFVQELLTRSECPVLLAPIHPAGIEEVVIAFDGGKSATYAAKQFAYLLPQLANKKVTILEVIESGKHNKDNDELFEQWLKRHCANYTFVTLTGNVHDVLFNYFMEHEENNAMLVAGSYGRTAFSRFFNHSSADLVMKATDVPLFIAHK